MALNIRVITPDSPQTTSRQNGSRTITVKQAGAAVLDDWTEAFYRKWEIEDGKRIDAFKARRAAAKTEVQKLAVDLEEAQAKHKAHITQANEITDYTEALQAQIDEELEPLRAECQRRAESHDNGDTANRLRDRRDALAAQRAMLGRPLNEFSRRHANSARSLLADVGALKSRLETAKREARLAATTDAELLANVKEEAGNWQVFEWEVIHFEEQISDCRDKITKAREDIANVADAESALADATEKRETVCGEAYIHDREPDKRKLATLDEKITEAEQRLTEARKRAAAAKAAIPLLEKQIEGLEQKVDRSKDNRARAAKKVDNASDLFARRLIEAANADHESRLNEIEAAKANHFRNWQHTESAEL